MCISGGGGGGGAGGGGGLMYDVQQKVEGNSKDELQRSKLQRGETSLGNETETCFVYFVVYLFVCHRSRFTRLTETLGNEFQIPGSKCPCNLNERRLNRFAWRLQTRSGFSTPAFQDHFALSGSWGPRVRAGHARACPRGFTRGSGLNLGGCLHAACRAGAQTVTRSVCDARIDRRALITPADS